MEKYQVFTPPDYVEKLLDAIGYKDNLMGKLILENSCGDGNILVAIVQRYIDDIMSAVRAKLREDDILQMERTAEESGLRTIRVWEKEMKKDA